MVVPEKHPTYVHLIAGGVGGTIGAVITCPLEVVKTRLQSSVATFRSPSKLQTFKKMRGVSYHRLRYSTCTCLSTLTSSVSATNPIKLPGQNLKSGLASLKSKANAHNTVGLYQCLRHIIKSEGGMALFKGLGPNLLGVAPSRAIYFWTYAQSKKKLNEYLSPGTPLVHLLSAFVAGFATSTATNPVWFLKTRLQLDQKSSYNSLTANKVIVQVYRESGIRGFYRGITASYYGVTETIIHFVIYEYIKEQLRQMHNRCDDQRSSLDFLEYMAAGATSKTIATCIAYPHEVARTRLREEGTKYRSFWQTLGLVLREEGRAGLYRGLVTQLVRQIPNTAITMASYEAVVYLCSQYLFCPPDCTIDSHS